MLLACAAGGCFPPCWPCRCCLARSVLVSVLPLGCAPVVAGVAGLCWRRCFGAGLVAGVGRAGTRIFIRLACARPRPPRRLSPAAVAPAVALPFPAALAGAGVAGRAVGAVRAPGVWEGVVLSIAPARLSASAEGGVDYGRRLHCRLASVPSPQSKGVITRTRRWRLPTGIVAASFVTSYKCVAGACPWGSPPLRLCLPARTTCSYCGLVRWHYEVQISRLVAVGSICYVMSSH